MLLLVGVRLYLPDWVPVQARNSVSDEIWSSAGITVLS